MFLKEIVPRRRGVCGTHVVWREIRRMPMRMTAEADRTIRRVRYDWRKVVNIMLSRRNPSLHLVIPSPARSTNSSSSTIGRIQAERVAPNTKSSTREWLIQDAPRRGALAATLPHSTAKNSPSYSQHRRIRRFWQTDQRYRFAAAPCRVCFPTPESDITCHPAVGFLTNSVYSIITPLCACRHDHLTAPGRFNRFSVGFHALRLLGQRHQKAAWRCGRTRKMQFESTIFRPRRNRELSEVGGQIRTT